MKACKGLLLFCFLLFSICSCFDPPEFSNTPEVSVNDILYKDVPGSGTPDSLIVILDFKDGDGDLGLTADMVDYPFNESFYFLADGSISGGKGNIDSVTTRVVYSSDGLNSYDLLDVPPDFSGKLVTNKTRNQPNYGYLPVYDPDNCFNYTDIEILVAESDNVVDGTYNIIDTLKDENDNNYFLVNEPFYYDLNENHYNIDVSFWRYESGSGTFKEYDWYKQSNCFITFNGRFPLIPSEQGSPLEGSLRYAMINSSFLATFSVNELFLKIRIRDRALNVSREITTEQFNLLQKCTNCN